MTVTTAPAAPAALHDYRAIEQFLFLEARLLDEQRFEEWVDLFDDEGEYWVPAIWNQPDPLNHVSIYYEDVDLLRMRVRRLRHKRTASQRPPSRTCHFISNVMIDADDRIDQTITVTSNLSVVEYRRNEQRQFVGQCRHVLKRRGAGLRILKKRFDLLSCDSDFGHLRLSIPF